MFGERLAQQIGDRGTPVLVGLDPRCEQLPAALRPTDRSPQRTARAYETFCREIIDVVAPLVAAVKPQSAFFEQLGPPGMAALQQIIQYARARGLIVIFDGKRNDIGSTAAAYAQAYLGAASPWQADAVTVSPYLGDDSLEPFITTAIEREAGVFVLVKTSNPGGPFLQDELVGGKPLYDKVARLVESAARESAGSSGFGAIGAVVGATYPEQLSQLRQTMPHAWLLVPGFGAQGAGPADVVGAFDDRGLGAIINSSRGIIFAYDRPEYRTRYGQADWQRAVEAATRDMADQLRAVGIAPTTRRPP